MSPVAQLVGRIEAGLLSSHPSPAPTEPPSAPDVTDPLVAAIADMARYHGVPVAPFAIIAGLPLVGGRLPLEHANAAAERAGLELTQVDVDPTKLPAHDLPCLVLMADGSVQLLHARVRGKALFAYDIVTTQPGKLDDKIQTPAVAFRKLAKGTVLKIRPKNSDHDRSEGDGEVKAENWVWTAFHGSRRVYSEAILATLAINILALALPLFTMNVYDRVLPNSAVETMWALAAGVMLATIFDFAIKSLRATCIDAASRRADIRLANFIYGRLLGAKLAERPASAGVRANTLREFETLRDFFNSVTLTAFGDLPFLIIFVAAIWMVAGPLVLIVLGAIPRVICIGLITQGALAKAMQAQFRETAQKNAVAVETLIGFEAIKSLGAESWAAGKWEQAVAEHIRTGIRIRHLSNMGVHTVHLSQTLIQIAMVLAGFYMVGAGQMTAGALIAATMLAGRALVPLGSIAMIISKLHQTRIAYRALSEIVNAPQDRPSGTRFITKAKLDGRIDLENVSFNYEKDGPPALRDLSLSIRPGERVGVIGTIGSGKTTILKLMQGLHSATSGQALIDGVSAQHLDPAFLRSHVGLLLQGGELFHGTIRSNITLADPGASDEAVVRAAHAAGALEWIGRLPNGFDTPVRERGAGLSAGQRQSVALARMLLRAPKVVLLDEPTSDLDGRTEQLVIQRLRGFSKGRTLVVVTHRPALFELVDRLVVIDGGRKVADGPKARVLEDLKAKTRQVNTVAPKRMSTQVRVS